MNFSVFSSRVTVRPWLVARVDLFPVKEQTYAGLLGLDMRDRPGRYELTIDVVYPRRTGRRSQP